MISEPLDNGLAADIENGVIKLDVRKRGAPCPIWEALS
jgi:hypothetical protein